MKIPHINNAFKNVKKACDEKLSSLYPLGIPDLVARRYHQELEYLRKSKYLDDFEIFRLLSQEAKKSSQHLLLRGTTTGSYIIYLLSNSLMNPLPAHYYCPKCGRFEQINASLFGIDLPESSCPDCKTTMESNGFNLSVESIWGLDGTKIMSFEYNISEEFRPFAKRVLKSAYPNNEIVPLGLLDKDYESDVISMNQSGFLILPMGQTIDDYSEMHGYLDDGDLCLTGNTRDTQEHYMRRILLLSFNCENYLVTMQRKTGIYISDISLKDLQTITWNDLINTNALASTETSMCRELKPKTYTDFIGIFACAHDTYADFEDSIYDNSWERFQLRKQPEFIEFPCYTREDFYDSAISQGLDNEVAFEFSELVRKGKVNRTPELLDDFNLPDSLKKTAESCLYLFPRAHCATCILTYATLAYYMKQDSRAFSRLIYKKK